MRLQGRLGSSIECNFHSIYSGSIYVCSYNKDGRVT